ncbi:MAG: diguanylate cyclase [Actinomycetota bacterium]
MVLGRRRVLLVAIALMAVIGALGLIASIDAEFDARAAESGAESMADRGAVVAYAVTFALAAASLVGLLAVERVARRRRHLAAVADIDRDELTGFGDASALAAMFDVHRPRRGRPVAVVAVSVAESVDIVADYGMHAADEVVRLVGKRLVDSIRDDDLVARTGGAGFLALIVGPRTETDVRSVAQRLADRLSDALIVDGRRLDLSVRAGAVIVSTSRIDFTHARTQAEAALRSARDSRLVLD